MNPESTNTEQVAQLKDRVKDIILKKPNVVGVGVGFKMATGQDTGELSVVVLVRRKLPQQGLPPGALVPGKFDGVPTDVIQVGDLRAQQSFRSRVRPAPGGASLGHYLITAGTLGCLVRDRRSGSLLILSNNHVLANNNQAHLGDPILQPGPYDGGNLQTDTLARLERFIPLEFQSEPGTCNLAKAYVSLGNFLARLLGSKHRLQSIEVNPKAVNLVDAAVARPISDATVINDILGIGAIAGMTSATLGMNVRKSGRSTGHTMSAITVLHTSVSVGYSNNRMAIFEDQILSGPMSQGGDSGSLVVEGNSQKAIGLLFAGSEQVTLINPIQTVLDILEVDLFESQDSLTSAKAEDPHLAAQKAEVIRKSYESQLRSKPNVVGVGIGYQEKGGVQTGQIGLVVMVTQKVPKNELGPQEIIPLEIEGVPVDVKEIGEVHAQSRL